MKFSKQVREEAAVLCLVGVQVGGLWTACQLVDNTTVDEPHEGRELARVAHHAAYMATTSDSYEDALVEAAALLRDGWSPGDPVVPWEVPT